MQTDFNYLIMLYSFYGSLLSANKKRYFELYYHEDFSLGEIAEEFAISRQAVRDSLLKAEQALINYEDKLHLFAQAEKRKQEVQIVLKSLTTGNSEEGIRLLQKMLDYIDKD